MGPKLVAERRGRVWPTLTFCRRDAEMGLIHQYMNLESIRVNLEDVLRTSEDFKNAYHYWATQNKQAYLYPKYGGYRVDANSSNQAALDLFPAFRLEAAAQRPVGLPAARSVEENHGNSVRRRLVSSQGDTPAITAAAPLSGIAVLSAGFILGGLLGYLCLRKRNGNRTRPTVSIDEAGEDLA